MKILLLLIPFVLFLNAYADEEDYNYNFDYKIYKDGSFEYNFDFETKDNSESRDNYISKETAYKECFRDGQIHSSQSMPFDEMYPMLLFESKKMLKQCGEGYKDGYYN